MADLPQKELCATRPVLLHTRLRGLRTQPCIPVVWGLLGGAGGRACCGGSCFLDCLLQVWVNVGDWG